METTRTLALELLEKRGKSIAPLDAVETLVPFVRLYGSYHYQNDVLNLVQKLTSPTQFALLLSNTETVLHGPIALSAETLEREQTGRCIALILQSWCKDSPDEFDGAIKSKITEVLG